MARRGHTKEGKVFCSECGSVIDAGAERCENCGEPLEGDFEAVICPYCATVLEEDSESCTSCGLRFKRAPGTPARSKEDEEFLSKLLDWGRNLEERRAREDKMETEKAAEVFKEVVGDIGPTPLQEETLEEIQRSAREKTELEKREESIIQLAEPLRKALEFRKHALDGLEERNCALKAELEDLDTSDSEADRRRSEIERQMAEIVVERNAIDALEENISNMDMAYRQLLKKHSAEIKEKEEKLNVRLQAFKKEMERREKEKSKLRAREEFLEKKEAELVARIESLREREESLKRTEERLEDRIAALEEERQGLRAMKGQASGMVPGKGKWMVDSKELKAILRKSKKLRDEWFREQEKVHKALADGEGMEEAARESKERLAARERDLEARIRELEKRLEDARDQEAKATGEENALALDIARLKKVLKVLDDLLENLPEDIVEKFARSEQYKEYDALMEELGL